MPPEPVKPVQPQITRKVSWTDWRSKMDVWELRAAVVSLIDRLSDLPLIELGKMMIEADELDADAAISDDPAVQASDFLYDIVVRAIGAALIKRPGALRELKAVVEQACSRAGPMKEMCLECASQLDGVRIGSCYDVEALGRAAALILSKAKVMGTFDSNPCAACELCEGIFKLIMIIEKEC